MQCHFSVKAAAGEEPNRPAVLGMGGTSVREIAPNDSPVSLEFIKLKFLFENLF